MALHFMTADPFIYGLALEHEYRKSGNFHEDFIFANRVCDPKNSLPGIIYIYQ